MSSSTKRFLTFALAALGAFVFGSASSLSCAATDLNDVPMAVRQSVKANFLLVLDNSQSMDGNMAGVMQSGDSLETRSNIGRGVLRDVLKDYQNTFRWGLMSFDTGKPAKRYIHVYYMGNDVGMVLTDDCIDGISKSHDNRRCVVNPQASKLPDSGDKYVTYDRSSDDPEVLDVYYETAIHPVRWGFSPPGSARGSTAYDFWYQHVAGNQWAPAEFGDREGVRKSAATDAGFVPTYPDVTRMFELYRGWGYRAPITGGGKLLEDVKADSTESTEHYDKLLSLLGAETDDDTKEDDEIPAIKNAALYTPLAGTLDSAKSYFSGQADGTSKVQYTSPIIASCQKNFVMLLTDGMPTGNKSGGLYTKTQRTDSCSELSADRTKCTGTWTFGDAAKDVFTAVDGLRSVPYTTCAGCSTFDVKTYVVAMGESVANAQAVAVMNEMARRGSCITKPGEKPGEVNYVDCKNAFFAKDANEMKAAVDAATKDAEAQTAAAAAVAVTSANVKEGTASFMSTYFSGDWTGDLKSYSIDRNTGGLDGAALWSAQQQLADLAASDRKIVSYSCSSGTCKGIRFRPAGSENGLSEGEQALLSSSDGAGIVDFIRGDPSGEKATPPKYRQRKSVLGDIINSEPVYVAPPSAAYSEASNPGYAAFKTDYTARPALVFQGANDGMLHAFSADSGVEAWAYVPSILLPTLAWLARVTDFSHKYYVDGTPTVGDVDFSRTAGSSSTVPAWRTILVGGLGKGGRGYYALDVTTAIPSDEAAAAAKVLWEFPNSSTAPEVVANLGYSFGKPIIAKVGDQGWVVLVSSGYNNTETITVTADGASTTYTGDGRGHLFVLNAKTGALIKDISTGAGSTESPSGLAAFSGYLDSSSDDSKVTLVYAGDLLGNVWRFDLTGALSTWSVSKLAELVDASDNPQPVTTAPELATIFENNATYRFVYVGTGRYLGDSDVTTTAPQTMYGLIDDLSATTPLIDPLRSNLQAQTLSDPATVSVTDPLTGVVTSTVERKATAKKFDLLGSEKKRGWYVDLPVSGERVSTNPQLAFGALVFTSNIPSLEDCVPGGSSYFNVLDYRTGGLIEGTSWSSLFLGKALASRPVLMRLENGRLVAGIRMSNNQFKNPEVPTPPAPRVVRRVSWRELPDSAK